MLMVQPPLPSGISLSALAAINNWTASTPKCLCGARLVSLRSKVMSEGRRPRVGLQCNACGRGIGRTMPASEHPGWNTYEVWREDLQSEYSARKHVREIERRRGIEQSRQRQYKVQSKVYREKFLRDPAWRALRTTVLQRDGWLCQGCLNEPATDVHHLTYEHGVMPPAFCLISVCRTCHDRLHDWRGTDVNRYDEKLADQAAVETHQGA